MEQDKKKKLTLKDTIYIITTTALVGAVTTLAVVLAVKTAPISEEKEQILAMQQYYNNKVFAFNVENSNLSKGQIVFIGDSITDLYHLDDYYSDLDKATYNRGIGGDTTSGVYIRLDSSLYQIEPSKIVLMIGINDINTGKSKDEIVKNYQDILDDIKVHLPSSMVYTMSICPMNEDIPGYVDLVKATSTIQSINTDIKSMSESRGYQYFDLFSLLKDENNYLKKEYSADGIHLSDAGFQVWTDLVKPSLI